MFGFKLAQFGFDRLFLFLRLLAALRLFHQLIRTARHFGKRSAAGFKNAPQFGKHALIRFQNPVLLCRSAQKGASGVFHVSAHFVKFLADHVNLPGVLAHRLRCMGKAAFDFGKGGGNLHTLDSLYQRRFAFFLKGFHRRPSGFHHLALGHGNHCPDL